MTRTRAVIDRALATTTRIPGDCGDEYRRPPFLTASGDLSHHLSEVPKFYQATPVPGRPDRQRVDSGSQWEPIGGYSRAFRSGNRILVSGTTATRGTGEMVCKGDVAGQTVYALDKIAASIAALGGTLADVVRTRMYLSDVDQWEPASRVHGRYFGQIRPANTLIEASNLVGDYEVEIEAEAELSQYRSPLIRGAESWARSALSFDKLRMRWYLWKCDDQATAPHPELVEGRRIVCTERAPHDHRHRHRSGHDQHQGRCRRRRRPAAPHGGPPDRDPGAAARLGRAGSEADAGQRRRLRPRRAGGGRRLRRRRAAASPIRPRPSSSGTGRPANPSCPPSSGSAAAATRRSARCATIAPSP